MNLIRAFFLFLYLSIEFVVAQAVVDRPLVWQADRLEDVRIEKNILLPVTSGSLNCNIYYPPKETASSNLLPTVVFANGGISAILDWRVYEEWAKLMAANGMIAIVHQSEWESRFEDLGNLLDMLHQDGAEYGVHPDQIGIWAASGNVTATYPQIMSGEREFLRAAVFYYGMPTQFEQLRQDLPLLIVRAGKDSFSLNTKIDEFLAKALLEDAQISLINYPTGAHAFDVLNDKEESRFIIRQTVDFFLQYLVQPEANHEFILTARNFYGLIISGKQREAYSLMKDYHEDFEAKGRPHSGYHRVSQEASLNSTIYQLISDELYQEAIDLAHFITELFPDSPNTYDSLADAYEASKQTEKAIFYSKKVLSLLPESRLREAQREQLKQVVLERLERLGAKE